MFLTVEKIISSGDGIGWSEGKTWFVPYSAPGETVEILSATPVRRALRVDSFRLIDPSADRRPVDCPLYGKCGGCNLLHLTYSAQRKIKQSIAEELFRQQKATVPPTIDFLSLGEWNLRTRTKVTVRNGHYGFFKKGSHEHLPFERCSLLHPGLNEVLALDAPTRKDGEQRYEFSVDSRQWLPREKVIEKTVHGLPLRVSLGSFFQSSEKAAEALATLFIDELKKHPPRKVLDLFCGVGLFSRFAVERGIAVTGIEWSPTATADFAHNLGNRAELCAMDVSRLEKIPNADLIVLDPPRTGLDRATAAAVAASSATRLFFVSCDLPTFVRDFLYLSREGGFALESFLILDQFPGTPHLETVALLSR